MAQGSVVSLEQARRVRLDTKQMHELQQEVSARNSIAEPRRVAHGATGQDISTTLVRPRESATGFVAGYSWRQCIVQDEPKGAGLDPKRLALELCRELDTLSHERNGWMDIETLVSRTGLLEEVVVAAAVYGHVRGWLTYAVHSVMLRENGRSIVRSRTNSYQ